MKITKEFELEFDQEKAQKVVDDLIRVYQKHKPTVGEIIISLSNLTYTLGAGIGGYTGKGPGVEELKRLYYLEPGRLDISMMLQAMTMATWYEDWRGKVLKPDTKDKEGTNNNESTSVSNLQGNGRKQRRPSVQSTKAPLLQRRKSKAKGLRRKSRSR